MRVVRPQLHSGWRRRDRGPITEVYHKIVVRRNMLTASRLWPRDGRDPPRDSSDVAGV